MADDPFDLERFVDAQAPVIDRVRDELRVGRKTSHWMWFVFPQIAGLGFSAMAQRYAIRSPDEAKAYLAHPILGPRLAECTGLVNAVEGRSAHDIFGSPDDLKFQACITLFEAASDGVAPFQTALTRYFKGERHAATLQRIAARRP
jgi:uncharacterized protein (DUF1810 family)